MLVKSLRAITRTPVAQHLTALRCASSRSRVFSSNALLDCVRERTLPPFKQVQIADIEPAVRAVAAEFTQELRALETDLGVSKAPVRWKDVVDPIELHSDPLGRLWGIVGHLMSVRNSEELRKVHDQLQPLVIQTITEASQSQQLYKAYQSVHDSFEWDSLSLDQQVKCFYCQRLRWIASLTFRDLCKYSGSWS